MKKTFLPLLLTLAILAMAACSQQSPDKSASTETISYPSENGPVQVPADPKRVVVLSTFAGHVMALGVDLVGVDTWTKANPRFGEKLRDVQEVSEESLEKIIELNPDLIIGLSTAKHIDKLKQIAPTVTFTYGKVDYLTQYLEIGKLLNKEKEAKAWIDDFKKRAEQAGADIRAKIGENATVSVIENFDKQLYIFGDHWGRGTEILYQEMKLKMPEKVRQSVEKDGYYALSAEVLPEYVGDYLIFSKYKDSDTSFESTATYRNMPAVQNNRVYEANSKEFFFNDPLTLEFQLQFFKKSFLGK